MEYFFIQFFYLNSIGKSYALSVSVCSGVAFQPAHCIVPLKNLAAASMSYLVLREMFNLSLTKHLSHPKLDIY
jgi:hypothetical protein